MIQRNAETNPPERVVFKGKPTEVYLHKLTLKDSIWLMWENKCKTGPHATEASGSNSEEVKASESAQQVAMLQRKHTHRNRAAETTFYAKYTFVTSNMELVNADPDSDGKQWTFTLPAKEDSRIVRQLRKINTETPGVDYKLKISGQYKFISAASS